MIRAILTDIEGTTSSISFVKDVLFPYAASHMEEFLVQHWDTPAVRQAVAQVEAESGEAISSPADANRILQRWIEEDRKATPLKALQGLIWHEGYVSGAYQAHVYADAVDKLKDWKAAGLDLYVYSSGSIAAQRLFFGYSIAGDMTGLFSGYFDTTTGAKQEPDSYRKIVETVGVPAGEVLFLSDIIAELDAARRAGLRTILLDRDGQAPACEHPRVISFAEIAPQKF